VTAHVLTAACQPDLAAEREHLAALLPSDASPAGPAGDGECAVLAWARSGLMSLTGPAPGPPLAPAAPVLPRAALLAGAIGELASRRGARVSVDLPAVLSRRAAFNSWSRGGGTSANRTCRLVRAADQWLAVNLARPDDVRSVPAMLGRDLAGDPWAELRADAATRPAAEVAARAQLLGIPAAVVAEAVPAPVRFRQLGSPGTQAGLVLDLSALWAGPLCTSILRQAGWRTLKVEDARRPDGARSGPAHFYASLHSGGGAVQLDLGSPAGRAELLRLACHAAVIVESSRPRALRGFGLIAEDWLGAAAGRVWVSITGYGRDDAAQRVAFGDDAAVAGGLVARAPDGTPVFCGDAIADPLTGIFAALAVLAATTAGGGMLADVAMAGVCADLVRPGAGPLHPHEIRPDASGWSVSHGTLRQVLPP
jgi:hypothetical protein